MAVSTLVCDRCGCALTSEPLLIFGPKAELLCSSRAEALADHYLYRQPFYGPLYARFAREFDGGKEDIALSARYVEILLQDCGDPIASVAEILRGDFRAEPVRLTLS